MTVSILLSNFNIQYLLLPLTCFDSHSTKFVCLDYNTLCLFIFSYLYLYKVLSLLLPDEDTCMSVSMKHRLLLEMKGYLSFSRTSD